MRACVCVCRTLYGVTIQISCLWDKVPSMKNVCLMEYNNHVVLFRVLLVGVDERHMGVYVEV